MNRYLAVCARGLEGLLEQELDSFGATQLKNAGAGVYFTADEAVLYRACLWSRVASRIVLVLSEFALRDDLDLYLSASLIDWPSLFSAQKKIVVDFNGTNRAIRNSQYGALKIKDAIVDRFTKANLDRPSIDKDQPDLRIHARLQGEKALIGIDLVGSGMHQRRYRTEKGRAPLRENLAAALVMRSGWQPGEAMLDPMCGSGTLLIEAALMAAKVAPGLKRERWGFESLNGFDLDSWREIHAEAKVLARRGLNKEKKLFIGYDLDSRVLTQAMSNAKRAGVDHLIHFERKDAADLAMPNAFAEYETGVVLSNPPYGERLSSEPALLALYGELGARLKANFPCWRAALYSSSDELLSCIGMRAEKQFKINNGALACVLKLYHISAHHAEKQAESGKAQAAEVLVAPDFANRLKKNLAKLEKWAAKEGIECYRIYDADLPNYNAAIDRYRDKIVIQEYAAPKEIAPEKARRRLLDMVRACIQVTGVQASDVVLKVREKQKGSSQYNKVAQSGERFSVTEYGVKLWVNLNDYLDTGLFLDHRNTRRVLGQMAAGKDFLNLFAYTGSATVHAACGGAKSTTTVDMSKTYLAWAKDNMALNGKTGRQHRFEQADCLQWLAQEKGTYDLIFIDPPTFSNSKRMDQTFDVQRDHLDLMTHLKRLLRPDGILIFSNNKRHFKMDLEGLSALGLAAKNLSKQSLPMDFARNEQIHNCWQITHQK
ncbi:Ribosomal RNA large subunit methyltransferase K/L [Vibrio stylophorae]|uniref:Ribosomal RNA large subunit methyltransferase K/L n=1 Tax=Vibrio stylophorae TaxID=659351 RepID=A0ABN8DU83_9VIBR|nr:bifunctional 23S rRNA (guanine(2069)-N(7))-methyltransferase RlmK/23S rRNA (guanine(2445)-N(2))-methyltransferase RlmL [Vibrio stylophorae]CAH0533475.1 Ribosomal RNA large subunit methyltransferase K/L [Vibrio stylophorae]